MITISTTSGCRYKRWDVYLSWASDCSFLCKFSISSFESLDRTSFPFSVSQSLLPFFSAFQSLPPFHNQNMIV